MKIMQRDIEIINFLKEVGVADTNTIAILFFNGGVRRCSQRLQILVKNKLIKYYQKDAISPYIYYVKTKPKNIPHKIQFSKLLAQLKLQQVEVLKYRCPFKIGDMIADGLIVIRKLDIVKIYFVEVELTKKLNTQKYIDLYYKRAWSEIFPVFPSILLISNKKHSLNIKELEIEQIKLN